MKKLILALSVILIVVSVFTLSAAACDSNYIHADPANNALIDEYVTAIKAGQYFNTEDAYFITIVDDTEMYQTYDGLLIKRDDCICGDVEELMSVDEILMAYEIGLNKGEYFTTDVSQHTVNVNGKNCHQKMDGTFVYDGRVLIQNTEKFIGYNILKSYIGEFYIYQIKTGSYIRNLGKMNYVVFTDTYDMCYVTDDGKLVCNGDIIYDCVATMDDEFAGTIIYQFAGTAVTVDSDFIYIYHFGKIVDIINIHTGGHPKG